MSVRDGDGANHARGGERVTNRSFHFIAWCPILQRIQDMIIDVRSLINEGAIQFYAREPIRDTFPSDLAL